METYLLANAKKFNMESMTQCSYEYDYEKDLNIIKDNGVEKLAVLHSDLTPTHSKTMAAPGDDDPDDARCY